MKKVPHLNPHIERVYEQHFPFKKHYVSLKFRDLPFSKRIPGFHNPEEEASLKNCEKRRKCW